MGAVERFCDRAMLIERGDDDRDRRARDDRRRYNELNFGRSSTRRRADRATATATCRGREIIDALVRGRAGERDITALAQGEPCTACIEVAVPRADRRPDLRDAPCATTSRHTIFVARSDVGTAPIGRVRRRRRRVVPLRLRRTGSRRARYTLTPSVIARAAPATTRSTCARTSPSLRRRTAGRVTGGVADLPHTRSRSSADGARPRHRRCRRRRRRRSAATSGGFSDLTWTLAVDRLQAALLRLGARLRVVAGAAAAVLRRPLLRLHADRSASATGIQHYPVYLLISIVLFTFFSETTARLRAVPARAREPAAQDALPAARDPALGRR